MQEVTMKVRKERSEMFFLAPLAVAAAETVATVSASEAFVAGAAAAYAMFHPGSHSHEEEEE